MAVSSDPAAVAAALSERLTDVAPGVTVAALVPLPGGACQDNYKVSLTTLEGAETMVLRSDAPQSLPRSLNRSEEFRVIDAAHRAGVETPPVKWLFADLIRPGAFAYLMGWVEGTAIGRQVLASPKLADARATLAPSLAQTLAKIHAITPATHADLFGATPPADPALAGVASVTTMVDEMVEPHPALELALAWLRDNAPTGCATVLNHGDFRTGNFMVTPQGLSAVLDWEFAQWGAPEEDLAWISVRDWRFGAVDKPIGGFASRPAFYDAYEAASGRTINRAAVHFFEVLGNVRWATGCVFQGERYLSGQQTDFELIAIARRAAEMEWEALRLIEEGHAG